MTAPDNILKVDDKWSVEYDPASNDRPIRWWRHGEPHSAFDGNNAVTAMFYALLEARAAIPIEAAAAVLREWAMREFIVDSCIPKENREPGCLSCDTLNFFEAVQDEIDHQKKQGKTL